MKDTENYKKVDGKFYLRELQKSGEMKWIKVKTSEDTRGKIRLPQ